MRLPSARLLAAVLAVAPLAAHSLTAQSAERYTLGGAEVTVYDPAGRVQLVGGSGSDVVVEVTRGGRDAARLRVASPAGGRTFAVIAPDRDLVYPAMGQRGQTTLRVRSDGTFDGDGGMFGRERLTIRGEGSGAEAWADLVVRVPRGRQVTVRLGAGAALATNVEGDLKLDVYSAEVTTEHTRGRLDVDAGSGRVRVSDAEGSEVLLDTGSGSVEVRGVRADRFKLDAGSGSTAGGEIAARDVDLDTGSGSLRLDRVRARTLKLDSGSGDVELELLEDVDDLRVDSGSGGVTLRLPTSLGAELDVDTGSGGIETEVPVQVTRRERDHLTGRLGDGRGRIAIDAGSGRVRLLAAR